MHDLRKTWSMTSRQRAPAGNWAHACLMFRARRSSRIRR